MDEYIESEFNPCSVCDYKHCRNCILHELAMKFVGNPAADVATVRHGKWRYYHKQNTAVCTECSFERNLDANFGRAVSCPNCGAKMDGDG